MAKAEIIKALRQLRDAHERLAELAYSEFDLTVTDAMRYYPYHVPLEDLNVPKWCNMTIKDLSSDISTVLHPHCLDCPSRLPNYTCKNTHYCVNMRVPFDKEMIIDCLVSDDLAQLNAADSPHILLEGIEGYTAMEDYEIYTHYLERIEAYDSKFDESSNNKQVR